MDKLLQKIVNGIVPSWLTRVKSSAQASPKKLLPFSRGDTHVSSIKSSAMPPSSSASNNILDHDHPYQSRTAAPITACVESSVDSASPPSRQHNKTSMKQKDGKHEHSDDDNHHQHHQHDSSQFEDSNDLHHPHHADMENCIRGMYSHATQIHAPNLLCKNQDRNDENHHPHHRHHQNQVESPSCDDILLRSQKRSPCNQCTHKDDNSHHHQKVQEGYHEQPTAKHKCRNGSNVGSKSEIGRVQEDGKHNQSNEAHNGYDHQSDAHNGYDPQSDSEHRDLRGFKRKSKYSKGDKDEEETGGGHRSSSMKGWGWKRSKTEKGLISCELPEGICGVVGNGKAVVKYSQEPHLALWESMVEMIVGNGLWEFGSLEFLLFCYLSLNEPHLHPTIQSSFLQVLKDLERTV